MKTALALVRSPEIELAMEALTDNAIKANYDQTFSFSELQELAGVDDREKVYQLIKRVNRIIIPKKKMYLNVRNNGYKIATASEQLGHSDKRRIRSMRQQKWAINQLNNINLDHLKNKEERDRHILLSTVLNKSLECARKRTLSGIKNSQKAVRHQEAALDYIETMKKQLEEFSKKVAQVA